MPLSLVRNDITRMTVDAIVDSAHPTAAVGGGVDAAIHTAAGPELLQARVKIGSIAPGTAFLTPGFHLPARFVVHTVAPVWRGGSYGEAEVLASCYRSALTLARDQGLASVAFPLLAAGVFGYPREDALAVAIATISAFLATADLDVFLVVYDRLSFAVSKTLRDDVAAYVDDHYVDLHASAHRRRSPQSPENVMHESCQQLEMAAPDEIIEAQSLAERLKQLDATFADRLFYLIDQSGKTDPEIYRLANLNKQHFAKIRADRHYRPKKATAVALGLALRLPLSDLLDLLGRASITLTAANEFDVIILYCVEKGLYDVNRVNMILFDFDQPLLGSY